MEIPRLFDGALQDIFQPASSNSSSGTLAVDLLRQHRRRIVRSVFHWTGLSYDLVRALVLHLEDRSAELGLKVGRDQTAILIQFVALITTLCMNRLATGDFVHK